MKKETETVIQKLPVLTPSTTHQHTHTYRHTRKSRPRWIHRNILPDFQRPPTDTSQINERTRNRRTDLRLILQSWCFSNTQTQENTRIYTFTSKQHTTTIQTNIPEHGHKTP